MDRTESGRSLLRRWEDAKPRNFYEDDEYLRAALGRRLAPERFAAVQPALLRAGADSAGPINRAAAVVDRPEHVPRLERWSATGDRTEEVVHHPEHHAIGRLVWRSGVLAVLGEPGSMTEHAALAYLFALNGEVPHLCSIACTAGLIKVLQRAGSAPMQQNWLPRLLDRDYDRRWHGAQFLTEVQGGSDVGANACVARPVAGEPGCWSVSGEKWFCSNVGADLYVLSARPEGGAEGTPGIALFVVPRRLDSGEPNGVFMRRLKNKLGTRTLPTAEVDFREARAWPVGELGDGFRLLMGVVINTSRLEVAIGSCGILRRAWVEAYHYARTREAFGRRLVEFPAVRQQLAEIRALGTGGLALTLWTAALEDRLVRAGARPEEDPLFRTAVNLAKYVCSTDAGLAVHHAIEVLGGNGTIEDFSPLPRLYREVPVQESWEGPHNTLMAQLLRDALRSKMHAALLEAAQHTLLGISTRDLVGTRDRALTALDDTRGTLETLLRGDPQVAALHVRALLTRVTRVMQAGLLLEDAQAAAGAPAWLATAADLLLQRARPGYDGALDAAYPAMVARLVPD